MSHERECQFQADEEFVTRFFCFEEIEELLPAEEFVSPEELLPSADQHWEVQDGREFFGYTKTEESWPMVDFSSRHLWFAGCAIDWWLMQSSQNAGSRIAGSGRLQHKVLCLRC